LIELPDDDYFDIVSLLKDGHTEQKIARRARILLAMAHPETVVQELAEKLEVSRNTIRHVSRRYEEVGIESLFDAPRSGRPRELSPPPTS
jgi:transposase